MRSPPAGDLRDFAVGLRADLLSGARGVGESRIANTRCRALAIAEKQSSAGDGPTLLLFVQCISPIDDQSASRFA
jgi:hypothetical protein